jgi:ABC-type dipeptide/oligopeptide/nickel transport system permease subunit
MSPTTDPRPPSGAGVSAENGVERWMQFAAERSEPEPVTTTALSARRRFIRRFKRQRLAMVALGFLVLVALVAVFAPWLTPTDPNKNDLANALQRPPNGSGLGTDHLGRDVLSRLIIASRVSMQAAIQSVAIGVVLGVPTGLVAGYFGGRIDRLIMRFSDALLSFPPLVLAIAVIAVLGSNLTNAMIAIGIIFAPRFLRLVRAEVLAIREETYVEAARSVGTPWWKIITRHVLPNALPPLIVQASLSAGFAMLAEASLSFLGLGVQPPQSSWGSMLAEAATVINREWTLMLAPGICIILITLAFNILGDGLRDSIGRETFRTERAAPTPSAAPDAVPTGVAAAPNSRVDTGSVVG